jgi:hypothetical protein
MRDGGTGDGDDGGGAQQKSGQPFGVVLKPAKDLEIRGEEGLFIDLYLPRRAAKDNHLG